MISNFFRFILTVFCILVLVILINDTSREYLKDRLLGSGTFERLEKINIKLGEIRKEAENVIEHLPEPLQVPIEIETTTTLSVPLILKETNEERIASGLPALVSNPLLQKAAEAKVADMFRLQYFEHESPEGKGPSSFVKDAGYEYLTIGENLALGMFKTEDDLIQAWMNSPGHRANILGKQFTEVGLAAKKGSYKGDTVWLAVQEFGKPISVCPKPSESERLTIEAAAKEARAFSARLTELKDSINATKKNDPKYNQMVEAYNKLVGEYNAIIKALEERSLAYNEEAAAFNACSKKETS